MRLRSGQWIAADQQGPGLAQIQRLVHKSVHHCERCQHRITLHSSCRALDLCPAVGEALSDKWTDSQPISRSFVPPSNSSREAQILLHGDHFNQAMGALGFRPLLARARIRRSWTCACMHLLRALADLTTDLVSIDYLAGNPRRLFPSWATLSMARVERL